MITLDIAVLFIVLLFIMVSLYMDLFRPAGTFLIGIVVLSLFGILTPHELLAAFSNEQIAVIVLLLILAGIINKTGVIDVVFERLFKSVRSYFGFMIRMMFSVAGASAFINNTPIVAMLIPYVFNWGKKRGIPVSKLLIPLSYACILGGSATLIGTSTNLIVNGLAVESGMESLRIFDFVYVGLPMMLIGIVYILLIGHRLLPAKKDVLEDYDRNVKEFLVETAVLPESPLVGMTVKESQAQYFRELFVIKIFREKREIAPVGPNQLIRAEDRLIFTGKVDTILSIVNQNTGLAFPAHTIVGEKEKMDLVEVVVSHNSNLIGRKVRYTNFSERYNAAILAVRHHNERITGKIADAVLHSGDILLLIAGKDLLEKASVREDFYVISKIKEIQNVDSRQVAVLTIGMAIAIFVAAMGFASLFNTLLVLISVVILFRFSTISQFIKYIDLDLLAILGFALAMGKALVETGAAELLSNAMIEMVQEYGTGGILATIFIITNVLAAFMTNKAAVAVIFPIAMAVAAQMGLNPVPFVLAVAYGGSASFITPIGYQTNLMVYGPGGYTFKDFLIIGLPLTLMYMLGCAWILKYVYAI